MIPVQLVSMEEPSAEDPVYASVLKLQLGHLGHKNITVAGRRWAADKFKLTVPLHVPFLIGTSPAGLLLDFAEEENHGHRKEQGMVLVRCEQWVDYCVHLRGMVSGFCRLGGSLTCSRAMVLLERPWK